MCLFFDKIFMISIGAITGVFMHKAVYWLYGASARDIQYCINFGLGLHMCLLSSVANSRIQDS